MCGKMNNGDMLILFLITLFGAIICTYCIRRILLNARIADNPIVSEHRHKSGTPTMGGIAFLFVILLIIAIYYNNTPILIMSYIMLAGGIVGLLDDLIGLKVKEIQKIVVNCCDEVITLGRLDVEPNEEGKVEIIGEVPIKTEPGELEKIVFQILLGVLLGLTGVITTIGGFNLGILAFPVVIIAILGCINCVNLIDGMDGLAAGIVGIASFACCCYLYLCGNMGGMPVFIILTGLCLGFLVFNKYPASIFMGDTGSFVLGTGYAAAVLISDIPYFGVLALGVPIASVVVSLLHRANIIKLPVEPLHHTLNHYGMSERKIVLSYWGVTVLLCVIGILAQLYIF